jgi:hypothetical protein
MHQTLVARQITRRLQLAVLFEVGRRRAQQPAKIGNFSGDQI